MRQRRSALITDAERSPAEQLRARQRRYVAMMSLRALCLVVAVLLVSAHAPLLGLWLPLCLAGMVLLPWLAVLIANDRPPKRRMRVSYHAATTGAARQLPVTVAQRTGEARVIDVDV